MHATPQAVAVLQSLTMASTQRSHISTVAGWFYASGNWRWVAARLAFHSTSLRTGARGISLVLLRRGFPAGLAYARAATTRASVARTLARASAGGTPAGVTSRSGGRRLRAVAGHLQCATATSLPGTPFLTPIASRSSGALGISLALISRRSFALSASAAGTTSRTAGWSSAQRGISTAAAVPLRCLPTAITFAASHRTCSSPSVDGFLSQREATDVPAHSRSRLRPSSHASSRSLPHAAVRRRGTRRRSSPRRGDRGRCRSVSDPCSCSCCVRCARV
jgi:hypothetical protein